MKNIVELINELLKEKKKLIIGIDGKCASGKTTLASCLEKIYDCTIFHIDDYFIPKKLNRNDFEYNFDYKRFKSEILGNLNSKNISYNVFNCSTQEYKEMTIELKDIIIIEGSYSLNKYFYDYYDLKIYLDIDEDIQIERLNIRNPYLMDKFINIWIPEENSYFNHELKIKDDIKIKKLD